MSIQWVPPTPVVQLAGTVTYRCADCGGDIHGEPVLAPLDGDQGLVPGTRAYHPDHAPKEVTQNGR